jgi:lipopolysaccharide transport system permease protein
MIWSMAAELYRYRELILILVYRDVKAKTKQAYLGYVWVIVQPLLATGVFSFLVQGLLKVDLSGSIPYPLFVFSGMILWQYFANSLIASTESLVLHQDLITQVYLSRGALVFYPIASRLIDFALSFVMLLGIILLYRQPIYPGILWGLVFILLQMILAFALGLICAPLNVALRDVERIVPLLLSLALYAAPVLYPLERVPAAYAGLYMLNPMAVVVEGFRRAALSGEFIGIGPLAVALAVSLVVLVVAERFFRLFEFALADVV